MSKIERAAREWIVSDTECAAHGSSNLQAFLAGAAFQLDEDIELANAIVMKFVSFAENKYLEKEEKWHDHRRGANNIYEALKAQKSSEDTDNS